MEISDKVWILKQTLLTKQKMVFSTAFLLGQNLMSFLQEQSMENIWLKHFFSCAKLKPLILFQRNKSFSIINNASLTNKPLRATKIL